MQENPLWTKVEITLLREFAVRSPDSPNAQDAQVRLIWPSSYASYGGTTSAPLEPFRSALETALNAEPNLEISADSVNSAIATILHLNIDDYKDHPFADVFPADNVLADGKPGWILGLIVPSPAGAGLAISGEPGHYRVVSARPYWRLFLRDYQKAFAYDLNANGIPEIAIWDSYWGTGMTRFCREVFELYEWDGNQMVNLAPSLETFANSDSGNCLDFTFESGSNGTQTIVTGNVIDTGCYDKDAGEWYGNLTIKRYYEWNGRYFSQARRETVPLQASIPGNWPEINRCTLSWVNEAGAANDQAYRLLPTLLAETDAELTTAFADAFGPAYLDYFRFKLGAWHAIRGQQAAALTLLTQVRDTPATSEFTTAPQLAEAFLQAYPSIGPYAGCAAARKLLNLEPFASMYGGFNTSATRDAWGFSEYQWSIGYGGSLSYPSDRDDLLNLCSLSAAFRSSVQKQSFTSSQTLRHWLGEQQIPYTGLQEGDVDGDGIQDWLLLLRTGEGHRWYLWALLNKNGRIQPVWIEATDRVTDNIPTAWNTFHPYPSVSPLNVYQWADGMVIFRIIPQGGMPGVEIIQPTNNWPGDERLFRGFSVIPAPAERSMVGNLTEELRVVRDTPPFQWLNYWYDLGWDSALNRLRVVSSPEYDQDQKIQAVEGLLFEKGDPQGAIEILTAILEDNSYHIVEPQVNAYNDLPEVQPYLQYLLGLAYELDGQEAKAASAYWALWHEHPQHPLSYVVQQKLERR